eukprot:scaffold138155_cov27-Tisochrysis_lutea.AAC.1
MLPMAGSPYILAAPPAGAILADLIRCFAHSGNVGRGGIHVRSEPLVDIGTLGLNCLVLFELGSQIAQLFGHTAQLIFKLTLSFASAVVVVLGLLSALRLFQTAPLIFTRKLSFSYL